MRKNTSSSRCSSGRKKRLPGGIFGLALVGCLFCSSTGQAQIDANEWVKAGRQADANAISPGSVGSFATSSTAKLLVPLDTLSRSTPGLIAVSRRYGILHTTREHAADFLRQEPPPRAYWTAPRRLLMDQAAIWTGAWQYRAATLSTGRGVVVGIVDTGIDVTHDDFRESDGTTRVAWLIDFFGTPLGQHPELEARYGCNQEDGCAVYGRAEINAAIASESRNDDPEDDIGHGTHVASLAAGNGASDPLRVGMAPEATLIIARVSGVMQNEIFDADILAGAAFIFDQADGLGLPVVANVSLGSDFGPHDGSSPLGEALSDFVGPEQPGHALVVAVGNSGALEVVEDSPYPQPMGIHTEVHVAPGVDSRIPILTPAEGGAQTRGSVLVWIDKQPTDELSIGFDRHDGPWLSPVASGDSVTGTDDELVVSIVNNDPNASANNIGPAGIKVIVEGAWPAGETFALRLRGRGTASVWIQSEGALSPFRGSRGALVPAALKEGTVTVPAAHPKLISVGATNNRESWDTRNFETIVPFQNGLDSVPAYSSAGPGTAGIMKPDIVAPGGFVVGALSIAADPQQTALSIFGGQGFVCANEEGCCSTGVDCQVLDDSHAVLQGTSMAAPIVAGALALFLERDPTLNQDELRDLMQAGARQIEGGGYSPQQVGPGALDLMGFEDAFAGRDGEHLPTAAESWLATSSSYARPDGSWSITLNAQLRDADGRPAGGFSPGRVTLTTKHAVVLDALDPVAPGLWRAHMAGQAGSGGNELEVEIRLDGERLLSIRLPIAVDRHVAVGGASLRGGCQLGAPGGGEPRGGLACLFVLGWAFARRPRRYPSAA